MRFRVTLSPEARAQRAVLPPRPKKRINDLLAELRADPFGELSLQLTLISGEIVYRVREDGYRMLFRPGPDRRQITVFRIALREVAYMGFEHPGRRD